MLVLREAKRGLEASKRNLTRSRRLLASKVEDGLILPRLGWLSGKYPEPTVSVTLLPLGFVVEEPQHILLLRRRVGLFSQQAKHQDPGRGSVEEGGGWQHAGLVLFPSDSSL